MNMKVIIIHFQMKLCMWGFYDKSRCSLQEALICLLSDLQNYTVTRSEVIIHEETYGVDNVIHTGSVFWGTLKLINLPSVEYFCQPHKKS